MTFLPFFCSIPDDYEHFQIAIETQEKLPQLEGLKIKLLEEYEGPKEEIQKKMFQMPCSLIKVLVGQISPRNRKILKLKSPN
jgi:hypothetical protein